MQSDRIIKAFDDIVGGFSHANIWLVLSWQEIKQRYRRSILGPYWLTLSTLFFLIGMGPIYGTLMKQNVSQYMYYVSISIVIWLFISGLISDGCQTFIVAEGALKQTKLPLTIYALQVVWRNIIIFAHNAIIIILITAFFLHRWHWDLLSVPCGLALIAVNGIWVAMLLGIVCARYRDIPQIITSLLQILMFVTPIMWRAAMLPTHEWIVNCNPLFHLMEIVRAPLLGNSFPWQSWLVALMVTMLGMTITFIFFQRYRARIAYWV